VSGTTRLRALRIVEAIAESVAPLSSDERDPSLAGEQAGLALPYAWLAEAGRSPHARDLAWQCLDRAIGAVDGTFRGAAGQRYRTERVSVEALLDSRQDPPARLAPGSGALRQRSLRLAPLAAELRELSQSGRLPVTLSEAASYAHMNVNRLLRSAQRAQALVLYELLDRSCSGRAGRRASSG
jgi:hypothetical protein